MSEDIIKEEIVEVEESQEVVETVEEQVENLPEEVIEEVLEGEVFEVEEEVEEIEESQDWEEIEEPVVEKKVISKKKTSTPKEPGMYFEGRRISSVPRRSGKKWSVIIDGKRHKVLKKDIVTIK